jgi:hypothetical protein
MIDEIPGRVIHETTVHRIAIDVVMEIPAQHPYQATRRGAAVKRMCDA